MRLHVIVALPLCLAAATVAAQSYRCDSGSRIYFSDRPCNGETKLQMYGPTRVYPERYSSYAPGVPRAQEHVKYLSPACASISEAIRTGPARGVRGDVIQGLHEEYREKCALEDQEARAQLRQEKSSQHQTQLAQRETSAAERRQAKERADRCTGMRDVIALKRRREGELNAKEVEALRNLEKTYNEVCLAR